MSVVQKQGAEKLKKIIKGSNMASYDDARHDFWTYCQMRFPKFYTDDKVYLHQVADTLQGIFEHTLINPKTGKPYRKVTISIPPRHGKSFILSLFNEWCMGKDNETRIINASYNDFLATRFSRMVRDGIDATKVDPDLVIFSDVFPGTRIKAGDAAMQMWSLEGQFFNFLATGFGGTITGVGCRIGIIDDPVKNHIEAANEATLDNQYSWYTDTFLSRLEEDAIQIIVMTRWSTKDLVGRILASEDGPNWLEINMPACADEATETTLCPKLLSWESYMSKKKLISPEIFDANYNGKPMDKKGRLYESFATYTDIPRDDQGRPLFEKIVSYTDTADEGADFLCSLTAGVYKGEAWVLDLIYSDEPMEVTEPLTAAMLARHNVEYAKIESNNGGKGFARSVERLLWENHKTRKVRVEWFHQSENKVARIQVAAFYISTHIYFPVDWAKRWPAYYEAMTRYQRKGKNPHDDAPDGTTGLAELVQNGAGRRKMKFGYRALMG